MYLRGSYRKSWATFFCMRTGKSRRRRVMVVDGTSFCVILECLVMSIACITWPVSLLRKWSTTICRFASVLSSNFLWKRKSLLQKFTRDFSVLMEVCAWVRAVFEDGWNILKMGTRASKRPRRNIILHDNARPHAACLTSEAIAKMGWEVLPHPSYSPDLAPSDYHLFGFVKDQLHGQRYETTEAIQKAMRQCLRMAGTEFYRRGIFRLPERWEKCVQRSGDYVEI